MNINKVYAKICQPNLVKTLCYFVQEVIFRLKLRKKNEQSLVDVLAGCSQ